MIKSRANVSSSEDEKSTLMQKPTQKINFQQYNYIASKTMLDVEVMINRYKTTLELGEHQIKFAQKSCTNTALLSVTKC